MTSSPTRQTSPTCETFIAPSAVVVALPDEQVVLCHEVLGQAGLVIHRHDAADVAIERIAKLMPRVVVIDASLPAATREAVEDRAIAIGAVLVMLEPRRDWRAVSERLAAAVAEAQTRFGRR